MIRKMIPLATAAFAVALPSLAQADVDDAKAMVEKYRQLPSFEAPGKPFDAKACMADKKIFVIPLTNANPFNAEISRGMKEAADIVGFELREWENQMQPDQWIQGISTAVAEGYDLIDLQGGLPPELLVPQIIEARNAGVKVSTTHTFDATTHPIPDYLDGSARTDYVLVGEIIAAWAIAQTDGKVNAIILGPDEIGATTPLKEAMMSYLDENCPDCTYKYINTPVTEWATKIQPAVQAALLADPDVNYVLPVYDSMAQFIVPAIQIADRADSVKVASYNGTPFVLDMIRDGDIVEMDVGESLGWVGMAGIDADMRLLCGEGEVTELNTPAYIFDDSNIETAGNPATFNDGYGDTHIEGFKTLWGIE